MNDTVNSNRGCFDRHDDKESTNEYASSPCFMHELDLAYFGLAPPSASDRKLHDPGLFFNALITRTLRKKIVKARWRLRMSTAALRQSFRKGSSTYKR